MHSFAVFYTRFGFEMSHHRRSVRGEQGEGEGDMQEFTNIENKTAYSSLDELEGVSSEESCSTSDRSFNKLSRGADKEVSTSFSV